MTKQLRYIPEDCTEGWQELAIESTQVATDHCVRFSRKELLGRYEYAMRTPNPFAHVISYEYLYKDEPDDLTAYLSSR